MHKGKKLMKDTFIYGIGNFGSKILSFLLLPLYSFYLTKEEFGEFDLIIVSISLLVPLISVQSSESVYRWLIDSKDSDDKVRFTSNASFVVISITAIFTLLLYLGSLYFSYEYLYYFLGLLITTCFLPFFQQVLRGLRLNKLYAISGLINTVFILSLNLCFILIFNLRLESLFIATIVANLITILFVIFSGKLYNFFSIRVVDRKTIRSMIKYSLPLIPNSIGWWLINASDKYLILLMLGVEANGLYAVSSRLPSIITMFNSIFIMAWQDHSLKAKGGAEETEFSSHIFDKFISFQLSLVIFLISIIQYFIKYFIDPLYFESWRYVPFLFIGVAFSSFSSFLGVGYLKIKSTKAVFYTTLIGGIVNLVVSLSLLDHIGLYAPALGTFLSFATIFMIRKYQTNEFFKIDVNKLKLFGLTLIAILYSFVGFINNEYVRLASVVIALFILIIMNRNLIVEAKGALLSICKRLNLV